jgi:hypothetical protein
VCDGGGREGGERGSGRERETENCQNGPGTYIGQKIGLKTPPWGFLVLVHSCSIAVREGATLFCQLDILTTNIVICGRKGATLGEKVKTSLVGQSVGCILG